MIPTFCLILSVTVCCLLSIWAKSTIRNSVSEYVSGYLMIVAAAGVGLLMLFVLMGWV